MRDFSLEIPTKIKFGKGTLQKSAAEALGHYKGNVLIITGGTSARKNGYLDLVRNAAGADREVIVFDGIHANPKVPEIDCAIKAGIAGNVKCVVGLGGGSALDAAKAAAAGIGMGVFTRDFLYQGEVPDESTLPIIAIPTTAGSGSELSKGAIVTDEEHTVKTGIRGDRLYPACAIVDPELTYSVPFSVTMETGFDVLAHAMESYISKKASPFSEMLSLYAIQNASAGLRRLRQNLEDKEARDELSYCSMLMGMNLGNVGTALPHRLQYPVGALTDTSHGRGLASIYPAWVECTYDYSEDKFNTAFSLISGHEVDSKETAIDAVRELLKELDMDCSFHTLGMEPGRTDWLACHVTGSIANDPASVDTSIIRRIYETSERSRECRQL